MHFSNYFSMAITLPMLGLDSMISSYDHIAVILLLVAFHLSALTIGNHDSLYTMPAC